MEPSPIIAPSILAADFAHLATSVHEIEGAADWVHVDVMDNHFVPNLTIGLPVVQSLRKATTIPFDVHLMIADPERWAPGYAEAGAYNVTFHAEACDDPVALAKTLRAAQEHGQGVVAVSGGVSCNTRLREKLAAACAARNVELLLAEPALCTDNAAMIGAVGLRRLRMGFTAGWDLNAKASLTL